MRYENNEEDIFVRLKNMELISPNDPQRKRIKEASEHTRKLVRKLNSSDNKETIGLLLSEITGEENNTVEVFTPIYINYGKNLKIGNNVFINFDCTFLDLGGITIEDDVLIGPKVSLITENHPLNADDRKGLVCKPIFIKKNAWIGANATILPGVTIGANAIVAAGAVISKDVEANTIVAGIPAKVIKSILKKEK